MLGRRNNGLPGHRRRRSAPIAGTLRTRTERLLGNQTIPQLVESCQKRKGLNPMKSFNWNQSTAYNEPAKRAFHGTARVRLRKLAGALGMPAGSYEIRSNKAGIAISGEITLHGESVYIQVNQSCMGPNSSILYRRCNGRRDYTGDRNHFAPLGMLDSIGALAARITRELRLNEVTS